MRSGWLRVEDGRRTRGISSQKRGIWTSGAVKLGHSRLQGRLKALYSTDRPQGRIRQYMRVSVGGGVVDLRAGIEAADVLQEPNSRPAGVYGTVLWNNQRGLIAHSQGDECM